MCKKTCATVCLISKIYISAACAGGHAPKHQESEYESMDEKLQDLLEAKEGVDEAAPDADLNNKYTSKRKYIRTKHGDLEGSLLR